MTIIRHDPDMLPSELQDPWPPSDEDILEMEKLWDEHLEAVPTPEERNRRLT
tara:strand:- start:30 stop:185 length:156 start_codon:yes stop_codon:yes gene_type:complete